MNNKNLIVQRFGDLTVIRKYGSANNRTVWECQCECGKTALVNTHSLTSGNTKSCGCKKYGGRFLHGEATNQTRLYRIWAAMKARCTNRNHAAFRLYGAKGVKVCDEWQKFEAFRDWANKHGYSATLTIDRIDSNGDYEPQNCRWVTQKVQSNNTSRNHYVEAFGKKLTIAQWANESMIPSRTIWARLNVLKWSNEDAVSIPVKRRRYDE